MGCGRDYPSRIPHGSRPRTLKQRLRFADLGERFMVTRGQTCVRSPIDQYLRVVDLRPGEMPSVARDDVLSGRDVATVAERSPLGVRDLDRGVAVRLANDGARERRRGECL